MFTCTHSFAANKVKVLVAIVVVPSHFSTFPLMSQAVIISSAIWSRLGFPEFDFPGSAVCPLPSCLLLEVVASQPNIGETFSFNSVHHILVGGIGGNRGQVSAFFLAEVLSTGPVLLVGAPEVAVIVVLFPALFAGFDALVLSAFVVAVFAVVVFVVVVFAVVVSVVFVVFVFVVVVFVVVDFLLVF